MSELTDEQLEERHFELVKAAMQGYIARDYTLAATAIASFAMADAMMA